MSYDTRRVWTRLRATDFTWYNPGALFVGGTSPTDDGTGIVASLNGGLVASSLTNPDYGAACWGVAPFLDADGVQVTGDVAFSTLLRHEIASGGAVGDNFFAAFGVANEEDLSTASVDLVQSSLEYTASLVSPRVRNNAVVNGAAGSNSASSVQASMTGGVTPISRATAGGVVKVHEGAVISVAGASLTTVAVVTGPQLGTGPLWLFVAYDRTLLADADAIAPVHVCKYLRPVRAAIP